MWGRLGNLPPIENRPFVQGSLNRPIFNRRQITNLPYNVRG
jgi:hypothetical protein